MKKAIKNVWIKALRSGKFKQGKAHLCDPKGKFCCLGVLAESLNELKEEPYDDGARVLKKTKDNGAFLTTRLLKATGLSNDDQILLANMNDKGQSFKKIANWIEKNL